MTIEKIMEDNESIYHDPETGDRFSGFAGGLAWPVTGRAFICVVGARFPNDPTTGQWFLRVVEEEYLTRMDELARRCATLASLYDLDDWFADREGEKGEYVKMLYDLGEEHRVRGESRSVYVYQSSLSQDIGLVLQVLRRRFDENTLIVPKAGILTSQVEAIHRENVGQAGLLERYPEVMALASVVHLFDQSPFHEDDEPESSEDDYHVGRSPISGY